MIRRHFTLAALVISLCFVVPSAKASWLSDKLKDTGKNLGGKVVDDKADSVYDATKEPKDPGQAEEEMEVEEPIEEPTPLANRQPAKKARKSRSSAPVRTDLHFSADTLMINPEEEPRSMTGKIFVDGAHMRWDMNARMDDGSVGRSSIIITGANPEDEIYTLVHEQKMYMVATVGQAEEDFWESFRMQDNPCDGYANSENLGENPVGGSRDAYHWQCSGPENADDPEEMDIWIDTRLGIPVYVESSDGSSYELKNIKESRPSADTFQLPKGYRKIAF